MFKPVAWNETTSVEDHKLQQMAVNDEVIKFTLDRNAKGALYWGTKTSTVVSTGTTWANNLIFDTGDLTVGPRRYIRATFDAASMWATYATSGFTVPQFRIRSNIGSTPQMGLFVPSPKMTDMPTTAGQTGASWWAAGSPPVAIYPLTVTHQSVYLTHIFTTTTQTAVSFWVEMQNRGGSIEVRPPMSLLVEDVGPVDR